MGKFSLLTGTYLLKKVNSKVSGEISVIKSISYGTYIQAANLTQSGGIVKGIWKKAIKRLSKTKKDVRNCLILGLGGGSLAQIVRDNYPKSKIVGVDIDKLMVDLGKEFLDLDEKGIDVVISDAWDFVKKSIKLKNKYDLVCVDLYVGDKYPKKFETDKFVKMLKKILSKEAVVIFNRLYYDEKRKDASIFFEKLQKHFSSVKSFFPEANMMIFCNSGSKKENS